MEFGDTLRRLREDAGMTQEDVVVGPQDEPVRILGVVVWCQSLRDVC